MAARTGSPRSVPRAADVVVIGAGAAGLAAAGRLREAGLNSLVLEARPRLGGRSLTRWHGDVPLDHGCEWLHSGNRNPWGPIATALGLAVEHARPPWSRHSAGRDFGAAEQAAFGAASDAFYARLEARAAQDGDTAASTLLDAGSRWTPMLEAIGTYINGCTFDELSVIDYDRYADTGVNWRIREGYGTLIAAYGARARVRLGCPATLVDHGGPRLRVTTPQGTLEADRVVVTIPSTLLATETLRFRPALPRKHEAAAGLPLGVANKVFFAVGQPEALPREGHVFGRTDRVGTGSYHIRPLGRPIIDGFFGGPCARELERDRDGFFAFALDEIAGQLGSDVRRHLTPIAATAWAADPWSGGSYSHALPGHTEDRAVLEAPVDGRLFFAGEACSRHDFSTAHGAYRTGIVAAEAVLATL